MAYPDFTYVFSTPGTSLGIAHSGGGSVLSLHLSESLPVIRRGEAIEEYQKLAKVLGFHTEIEGDNAMHIHIGEKSPDALAMFMARDMETRKFIGKGEGADCVKAVLAGTEAAPHQRMTASMTAALDSAQAAKAVLASSGVTPSTTHANEKPVAPSKGGRQIT